MATPIYLVSLRIDSRCPEVAIDDARRCRNALEKEFPGSRFDSETVEGVLGVRYHLDGSYDLADPKLVERRAFARGFMASAPLWER